MQTRTRVIVLRHAAELRKRTGTVRWAALALQNFELHDYALEGAPLADDAFATEGAWLLFPGPVPTAPPKEPPARLIVPDGTWQQARRMVARLPALRGLPRLGLPPPASEARRLRQGHFAEGMSTLEAIAAALASWGDARAAGQLRKLHRGGLARIGKLRGREI